MAQLKVFIISDSKETRYRLKSMLEGTDTAIVGYGDIHPATVQKAQSLSPDVAVLCHDRDAVFDLGERLYQSVPGCAMVLAGEELTMGLVRRGQASGMAAAVSLKEDAAAILDTISRAGALERSRAGAQRPEGGSDCRVISLFSPKGGTGKTTLAVNLACAMAGMGKKTALVDLNLECACATLFLDMQAKDTVAELSQERGQFTMEVLRSYTVQHYTGVTVLAGPNSPEDGEYVQARSIEAALAVMRPFFDCILVDLPANYAEITLTALENSDKVLLVLQPDIASVKAAHAAMGILTSLRQSEKAAYVFNKSVKGAFLGVRDVKRALGREPEYVLPLDGKTAEKCQCVGRPIVNEAPRTLLAKQIKAMAKGVLA